jgi:hypothetical protein
VVPLGYHLFHKARRGSVDDASLRGQVPRGAEFPLLSNQSWPYMIDDYSAATQGNVKLNLMFIKIRLN